jgi:hypothetical protein
VSEILDFPHAGNFRFRRRVRFPRTFAPYGLPQFPSIGRKLFSRGRKLFFATLDRFRVEKGDPENDRAVSVHPTGSGPTEIQLFASASRFSTLFKISGVLNQGRSKTYQVENRNRGITSFPNPFPSTYCATPPLRASRDHPPTLSGASPQKLTSWEPALKN